MLTFAHETKSYTDDGRFWAHIRTVSRTNCDEPRRVQNLLTYFVVFEGREVDELYNLVSQERYQNVRPNSLLEATVRKACKLAE